MVVPLPPVGEAALFVVPNDVVGDSIAAVDVSTNIGVDVTDVKSFEVNKSVLEMGAFPLPGGGAQPSSEYMQV